MRISLSWLNDFLPIDLSTEELEETLVSLGLEVEGIEKSESIKGGLVNYIIGEVITCAKHPNADKLSVTKVNVGKENLLDIVCGAPNVAKGQKVVVAMENAVVYNGDQSFIIKKTKLRGEPSEGMICAEDELGIGNGHDGIIVLDPSAKVGTPAAEYFGLTQNVVFEIGLTPNRVDAASHLGVARDLAAKLSLKTPTILKLPDISKFSVKNNELPISITIENDEACPRYTGLTISGITIKESPKWLADRLKLIGLKPINNVVDATNYVLHELGQPLHAFDAAKIKGKKVIVKCMPQDSLFTTLDGVERKLSQNDLIICSETESMCIAGVFGGLDSGITEATTAIFLESAWFNPSYIRKTSRKHALYTDASYRFERGTDPNMPLFALKRAALLIQELTGGYISMTPADLYPNPIENTNISISFEFINRIIGKNIEKEIIKTILKGLEIEILKENDIELQVSVPPYRVDVKHAADIVEEILRHYGFNNVEIDDHMTISVNTNPKPNMHKLRVHISNLLSSAGFNETLSSSLTKANYYQALPALENRLVKVENALSSDLGVMRASMVFGLLESIERNIKHKNPNVKFYEFGYIYENVNKGNESIIEKYIETQKLCLAISGNYIDEHWQTKPIKADFYTLKAYLQMVFKALGFLATDISMLESDDELFLLRYNYTLQKRIIGCIGIIKQELTKPFDIDQMVYYAELNFDEIINYIAENKPAYKELPKYPEVRRDLALLIDKTITYKQIEQLAYTTESSLLKGVNLFDVFESEKLGPNKKSYAVSFILRDDNATLTDEKVEKIMNRLIEKYKNELLAEIR